MAVARLAGEAAGEGGSAFVIGGSALKEMVAATGARLLEGEEAEAADVVVVSGHRGFDYEELKTAKFALDRGARLFATSHDPTMPYPGGELPGTGAVLAAVEVASGTQAEIAGKPERHLFEMAMEAIGRRGDGLAMIGDRDLLRHRGRARGRGWRRSSSSAARPRARKPRRPTRRPTTCSRTSPACWRERRADAEAGTGGPGSASPGSSPSPSSA